MLDVPEDQVVDAQHLPTGAQVVMNEIVAMSESQTAIFVGPLPPAGDLQQYTQVPGALEWIFGAGSEERHHRHAMERSASDRADRVVELMARGQWFGLALGALSLVASMACAYFQQPWPAGIIGAFGTGSIILAFVLGRRPRLRAATDERG